MVSGQAASDSEPESSPKEIPVVDFANWKPGSSREERMKVAQEIVSACRDVGFVYIVNHGMAPEKVAEAFAWSEKFFNLSSDEKQKAPHPSGASVHRGYSSPGLEKVSQAMSDKEDPELAKRLREITDYKESYDIGSDGNQDQPNVWIPEEMLPGFRSFMTQFYWDCFEVTKNVLRAISIGIGLEEEDYLLKFHSGHNNQLRLLHYPPLPAALLEEQKYARMPSHTDWSTITFLFQDECGGLEVEDIRNKGRYIAATPIKDAIVMNVGDLLQRWSNDYLRSTFHRVTLPPLSDRYEGFNRMVRGRYSIPYFTAPDPTSVIKCLPSCVSEDKPASYLPITQHDYNRLRASTHYETAATNTGGGAAY
ncbi:hypothetical protein D8B26_006723 [Coccidioides posadasii str. Silveira]|uniref:Oxidoreductase n=3 Tax=Coccidioides posadasii TaxID=199306 RepID=E9CR87_COCPS|nr:isopenicillin N synthetase, putative [Coccidioides posadasii C735 delta SOWgp]EER28065.1 isopenicillin N synthetase, putative [Coccidioides posadasii C735 delta SOWgp]EFW23219.1 oxidoreductase [Coccidioides posadasii str. Silveira]KMM68092.1 oxidoreductase [Coccidioides posadasii RMSCC 3488]QVM12087.1 hypothetical protein D8B26_006723 [Coccidioides posadasii str. Silveira]|eukprot:XP_003070210.1 isopenicillin N synthetase, putative [Coccidioides posadasii C735 delta SOWgp]